MQAIELLIHHGERVTRIDAPPPGESIVLGRSPDARPSIPDASLAFEHVALRNNDGVVQVENLASGGTWLNGERLTSRALTLHIGDEIRLSDAVYIAVVPAASSVRPSRSWPLVVGVAALVVLALGYIVFSGSSRRKPNTVAAFARLDAWVNGQVRRGTVPAEVSQVMREAWRLEKARLYEEANVAWARAGVAASVCRSDDGSGQLRSWAELSGKLPKAIDSFLYVSTEAAPEPGDATYAAAVVQFINDSAEFNEAQAKEHKDD